MAVHGRLVVSIKKNYILDVEREINTLALLLLDLSA
jgi:hypothetical protein